MTGTEFLRELVAPLASAALVLATLFYLALIWLFVHAGLVGLFLAIVTLPSCLRYLMRVLEARANGAAMPIPEVDDFSPFGSSWPLGAVLPVGALVGLQALQGVFPPGWPWALASAAIVMLMPASLAILAITHSPAECIRPTAVLRLLRATGPAYLLVPATVLSLFACLALLSVLGLPGFLQRLGEGYLVVLVFTLTGAVLARRGVATDVDIDAPVEPSPAVVAAASLAERQRVLNHAYGFASRGNRKGGLAHVRQFVAAQPDVSEAGAWFFNQMLGWDSKDPALDFGAECLAHFLHHDEPERALKVMSACLHHDPLWRPRHEDFRAAVELARKHRRDDLATALGG